MKARLSDLGHAAVEAIARQTWLAPAEDRVQRAVGRALDLAGPRMRNFLHGTWLGHPLHPVLTDVPIGAWTVAVALDAADSAHARGRYAAAADRSIAIGIVGAVGAAAAGMADWRHTDGRPRRTGFVHAIANSTALALFVGSLVMRRRGRRGSGQALSSAGFMAMLAGAYLGGSLVYRDRIGVDHSRRPSESGQDIDIDVRDLPEGGRWRVEIDGVPMLIVRERGHVYALSEKCSHMGGPLGEGTFENGTVTCPWHGSRFCLADGRVLDGPATIDQPQWIVHEANGKITIRPAA